MPHSSTPFPAPRSSSASVESACEGDGEESVEEGDGESDSAVVSSGWTDSGKGGSSMRVRPVSYTHLDVYKRQELYLKTYDEMLEAMRINGGENGVAERELAMTSEVAAKCNCELPIIDDSDLSQYHFPVFDVKKDFSYPEYSKAGDFEIPEHTKRAIVHGFATNDSNDGTITDLSLIHI